MNDLLICSEIAEVIKAASAGSPFAAFRARCSNVATAQAGITTARPLLTISGQWKNYPSARLGVLMLELKSRAGDQLADVAVETAHQQAFDALFTAFLGVPGTTLAASRTNRAAAFTAVKAAVEAGGKVTIAFAGPAEGDAVAADFDGEDYVNTLRLNMAWGFVPAP